MAQLPNRFNVDEVPPDEFEKLPVGRYLVQIVDSDCGPNSKGTGEMVSLQLAVMEGHMEGRIWFENLNIVHENPKVENMANQLLAKITKACGKGVVDDTEELHGIPFYIDVADRVRKDTGEVIRHIKGAEVFHGMSQAQNRQPAQRAQTAPAPQPTQAARPAPSPAPAQNGGRPWARRA